MARPSLKNQRTEQILDAFETCVARYGLEGATLERIAEEADLARALIRHNVGNREELLDALVERYLRKSSGSVKKLMEALPANNKTIAFIDLLFDPKYSNPELVLVASALIAAGASDDSLAKKMRKWIRSFVRDFKSVLSEEFPNERNETLNAISAGVTGIYFNVESMTPIGAMSDLRAASKDAALRLIASLDHRFS